MRRSHSCLDNEGEDQGAVFSTRIESEGVSWEVSAGGSNLVGVQLPVRCNVLHVKVGTNRSAERHQDRTGCKGRALA
jgi:hypothetical protein